MMKNLMHRIKAPTVLLMLLFLFLGGVISVKAEATSFGTGSSWEIDGSVLYININNTGDFTTYINDWQGGDYGATLITAMNGAVTKVVVKTLGSATLNSYDAKAFYFTGDGGNITTIDFSEAVFDSHAFEQLETDQTRDGSVIYNLIVPDADKLNPSTAMGGTAYNLFGKNGDELIAVINNYSKLVWSDVKGSCTTLVINQDITSDLDLSTSGFSTFIFNGTLSAYVTLPDGKTAKINDESQGIYIKSDNEETGTGITFVFPKAKEGIFGTGSSAYLLSKDGKTLTLNIKATGDLASIEAATDWEAMSVAETVNVEMDGGSLNAADINKLMSSFPSATTINLANATISEDVTISNSTVTTLNLTGIDATGHNITISGCNYIAKVNLSKAKAETITVTGWTGLIEVNVTSATFTSLVVTGASSAEDKKVKIIGTVAEKVSGSYYYIYEGEKFGVDDKSKYLLSSDDEIITITLAAAGDFASLSHDAKFDNVRLVVFKTNENVVMNAADFTNMNIFGQTKSVILDFNQAVVDDAARNSANLNTNGVVIGTAVKLDPQTTYNLYNEISRGRINAMLNIANYNGGTNNSQEIYAEAETEPSSTVSELIINYLLKVYSGINDVVIQGGTFHNTKSDEWLENTCSAFNSVTDITSFRVYEYTINANATVQPSNSKIKYADFAYVWDEGITVNNTPCASSTLDLTKLSELESVNLSYCNLKEINLGRLTKLTNIDITGLNPATELILTGCTNTITIKGGEHFVALGGKITGGVYTLAADSPLPTAISWSGNVEFGDKSTKSSYRTAFEGTLVEFTIANAGDLKKLTNDDPFKRARVVSFKTNDGVSMNADDMGMLYYFGSKGEVNLDFTRASVEDAAWGSTKFNANGLLIITPKGLRPRTFYTKHSFGYAYCITGVANIFDIDDNGELNTLEYYSVNNKPLTIYRRLFSLYQDVKELLVHGNLDGGVDGFPEHVELLARQLSSVPEIKLLQLFNCNFTNASISIENPNLTHVDFSSTTGLASVDLKKCTSLKEANFAGATVASIDASAITGLQIVNVSDATGLTSLNLDGSGTTANPVKVYGGKTINDAGYITGNDIDKSSDDDYAGAYTVAEDRPLPYTMDPNTDLDITIDLDLAREWTTYGLPQSLRHFLRLVRADLAKKGNNYIKNADPNNRYNYVKIKGGLKPKNMGALNMYIYGDGVKTEESTTAIDMSKKFDEGDIVCKYLDLSEATPVKDTAIPLADGTYALTDTISWYKLLRSEIRTSGAAVGLGVQTAAVDYVILPPGLDKKTINAETFKGFLDLKAAGSASEDGTELVAYVKEAGSLYYLTAYIDQLNKNRYAPLTEGGRSVCTDDHDGKVGYKHWFYSSKPNNLKHLTLSGNVNAFDLANDVRSKELPYEIIDGHLKVVTATPASAPRREGEKVSTAACAIEEARVASMTGPTGALYFVTLESLDLSDATIEKPIDMTLSGLGSVRATGTDEVFVKIPKNTTELPDNFANNIAPLKEIHLPYTLKTIGYKAFWETNLLHVTCEDEKGNIIDKNPEGGKDKYGNDVVTYALPAKLELIKTGAFAGISEVYITDVYVMATTAPKCQKDAFDASTYMGNFGFKGNDAHPIKRSNYKNGTEASAKLMTILHFPAGIGDDEAMKYTDIDRKYSLQDENGDVNGEGRLKMWPTHSQIYRSYHQALVGVTWKYWSDEDARGGDGPLGTIGDAVDTFTPTTWVDYETVADKTNVYNYDDYMGWHQFVLADYYSFDSDDPVRDFTRFKKNVWYSICFPYNMTKSQLLEYFGAKKTGDYVTVNGTKYYEDVYPEVRTLIQVLRSENEKFITFMFSNDLVRSESKIELSADGKTYSYNTEDVEKDGEDPIIIEGGKPYILRPCYPDDKTNKTTGVRPTAYKSTPNIKLVGTNPYGTTRTDGTVVPYTDHNVWAIDYDATKTSDKIEYANESESVGYMYNFVGAYSSKHVIPQYSYFFGVPKDEFITKLYRDMTTSTTRRPWTQYTAIIGGRATARIDDGDTSAGEIASNVKLVFTCKNDDLGPVTAGAKPFTYNFAFAGDEGNEPNAIENVTISEDGEIIGNGPIYNLNGIRINGNINSLQKGIYIMNGRKFVVK